MFQLFEYFIFLFMDSRLGDAKRVSNLALCHFLKEKSFYQLSFRKRSIK